MKGLCTCDSVLTDFDLDFKKTKKKKDCTTGNAYLLPHLLIMKFGSDLEGV
jgi:hypothetical protein